MFYCQENRTCKLIIVIHSLLSPGHGFVSCTESLDNACVDGSCVSKQGLEQGSRCWVWAASGDTATSPPWPPVGGDGMVLKRGSF